LTGAVLLTAILGILWAFAFPVPGRSDPGGGSSLAFALDEPVAAAQPTGFAAQGAKKAIATLATAERPVEPDSITTKPAAVVAASEVPGATADFSWGDGPPPLQVALVRALRGGEPAAWVDPGTGEAGLVVVGQVDEAGGRSCRDVVVFTRVTGVPDRTAESRKCLNAAGVVVSR